MVMDYQPVRELGRGMFGVVSLAFTSDGQRVITKRLETRKPASETTRRRFCLEAEAMRRIRHPNVMPVLDVRADANPPFFVMPMLEGAPLGTALRQVSGPLSLLRVVTVLRDLAHALNEVHRHGLVHRDVKPDNIFVKKTGESLLFDFGLVKDSHGAAPNPLTAVGEIIGTPAYMAPEQIRGGEITGATDVYAFGVVATELLTGRNPFLDEDEVIECIRRHLFLVPEPLDQVMPHRVSPDLSRLIARCLEKDARLRPTSVELAARLDLVRARVVAARGDATRCAPAPAVARPATTASRAPAPRPATAASRGPRPATVASRAPRPLTSRQPRPLTGASRQPRPLDIPTAPANRPAAGKRPDPPSSIGARPAGGGAQRAPVAAGKRPDPPSSPGKRPDAPSSVGKRPDPPSSIGKRPDAPSSIGKRPDPPSSVGARPAGGGEAGRAESPGKRPETPSSIGKRPDAPSAPASRPRHVGPTPPRQSTVASSRELIAAQRPRPEVQRPKLRAVDMRPRGEPQTTINMRRPTATPA